MFLPNTHSFLWVRRKTVEPGLSPTTETSIAEIYQAQPATVPFASSKKVQVGNKRIFVSNTHSFLLIRSRSIGPDFVSVTDTLIPVTSEMQSEAASTVSPGEAVTGDPKRRSFLKVAGVAGAALVTSQLLPQKASALVLGSSPTTGIVGVKNASNVRINPATEETVSQILKTSDLTFDTGSLEVKVTGLPTGFNSFSDSGDVAKSALVDVDRHVQVDVLSSVLPASASTETTLQTISFGGFKFSLRLDTVGSIDYVGEASIGTATSAASWRIKKVDSTTGIIVQWAGTGVFDQVWDNRASLSYA